MTIKKSLQVKAGYQHRIHRTKKNRKPFKIKEAKSINYKVMKKVLKNDII